VLDIVMDQLGAAGFRQVTIATGYMGELIEAVITHRNGSQQMKIDYVREAEPLGTVGPLRQIDGLDQPFLMMNGDVLTDLDYGRLLRDHVASGAMATIATTTRHIQITLGVVECGDGEQPDRLTGFIEKPRLTYDVSMGIYCFSPKVLDHIEADTYLDLPDLVRRLVARGEQVRSWRSDSYWVDLGMREDYERAVNEFETMRERLLPGSEAPRPEPADAAPKRSG
jgi:NDP-mannose synthase